MHLYDIYYVKIVNWNLFSYIKPTENQKAKPLQQKQHRVIYGPSSSEGVTVLLLLKMLKKRHIKI